MDLAIIWSRRQNLLRSLAEFYMSRLNKRLAFKILVSSMSIPLPECLAPNAYPRVPAAETARGAVAAAAAAMSDTTRMLLGHCGENKR